MNLERISIKMGGANTSYMSLAKISDFSKLYTTILFVEKSSPQKINTGDSIQAFNFKNIEQFKGLRPFNAYTQEQLLFLYNQYGSDFLYQTKLHSGDLVRYNGLKYVVLGVVVNTYAQWNMPTPLLFNPTNLNNDYKSLYGSRLTEEQINSKINDNFQAGKYDADMVIPLVDANDFSEYITVIEPRPTKEEVELMFDSVKAEKDLTIKSQKDVFIDTMLRLRGNEINKIKEVNEDLFKGVQTLLLSVNKAVNEQIELLPEPVKEKPARKPREKKVIEEVEPVVEIDSDDLPNFIGKDLLVKDYPEQVKKLIVFRSKQQDVGDYIFDDSLTFAFNWDKTPEGMDFWSLVGQGNLIEFKAIYGNKGEKVDELIAKEELPKAPVVETTSEYLPNFISSETLVKDLPKQVRKLALLRMKEENIDNTLKDNDTLDSLFNWIKTLEGGTFWEQIHAEGDLTEFKKLYGNKGEKVDDLIAKEELPKPVKVEKPKVEKQEIKRIDIILYPPEGGVLEIKTDGLYELFEVSRFILTKYKSTKRKFNFSLITDYATHTTEVYISGEDSPDKLLSLLVESYDKFGYFNWKNFDEKQADIDKIKLNEEIINDSFKPEPKPVEVKKPKPVKVEKPKPVVVEKPKPIVREKPRPVPVEKPKPVKVEKPKVEKVVKQKVTKPKVEDDLSFLDDLDNIF